MKADKRYKTLKFELSPLRDHYVRSRSLPFVEGKVDATDNQQKLIK